MRAVWLREFGSPAVLHVEDTAEPTVASGQALIGVEFAGITWIETSFRASGFGPFPAPPMIPGNGVGGTVLAVGDDADRHWVGRRVVAGTGGSGGYAERVAVGTGSLIGVPDGVATDEAVALLADGRTALMIMAAADVRPGDRVLVEAAAGGVGSLLVQLAVAAGARVVAAAGGAYKAGVARDLGAHAAVDYREVGWADEVRAAAGGVGSGDGVGGVGGVDVVLDGVGGDIATTAFDLLADGGRMISFGFSAAAGWPDISDEVAARRGIRVQRGVFGPPDEQIRRTTEALALAASGGLRPVIGQWLPLERAAEAHAAMEARSVVGKTVLTV
ncbi:zinc-binding dehydrogenase [Actinoplanes sp. DH11]|uniref:zinc-binding dehydrogenase n=1 Tax=Actinoplanes sp. DH11 TaxID=2857011 RepID=UPI001E5BC95D|nr:zinc-binding dehydrogenase [Actinoplanes sp. DH11]